MALVPVRYHFTQKFSVPVEAAFRWAIDYDPSDFKLMGIEGRRKIQRLSEDTVVLVDATKTEKGWVEKTRLVRIIPERWAYTNTHVGGPTLHSQFWYEFFPEGDGGSRLEFTGLLLYPSKKRLSKEEAAAIAVAEKNADSKLWKLLARAMEADMGKPARKR